MDLMSENHLVMVFPENTIGQRRLKEVPWISVYQVKDLIAQRKWSSLKVFIWMKLKFNKICIEKLMVITNQENRKREITTGKWTQLTIFSVMENKRFWMELQKLFVLRDMEKISQKLLLQKRQLKTLKESPLIF